MKASRWGDLQISPDEYRKQAGMMKEDDKGRFSPPSTSSSSSNDRVDQGRFSPPPLPASTATSIHEGKDDLGPPLPARAPAPPPPPPPPPKAPPPPSPPVSSRVTKKAKGNQGNTPRMQLNGGRGTAMQRPDALPMLSQSTLQGATHPQECPPAFPDPTERKYFVGYYNADGMGIVAPPVAINLHPLPYTRNAIPAEVVQPPHQVRAVSKDCWEKVARLQHVRSTPQQLD